MNANQDFSVRINLVFLLIGLAEKSEHKLLPYLMQGQQVLDALVQGVVEC